MRHVILPLLQQPPLQQSPSGSLIDNDYTVHIAACWILSAVLIGGLIVVAWRAYRRASRNETASASFETEAPRGK